MNKLNEYLLITALFMAFGISAAFGVIFLTFGFGISALGFLRMAMFDE